MKPGKREFGAPWGWPVALGTSIGLGVLALTVGAAIWGMPPRAGMGRWLVGTTGPLLILVTALFSVRGYAIEGRTLLIRRLVWTTRLSLEGLREVTADPQAMRGSLRTCGNGGLFAVTGWYRSRRLGSYRAWVTDPKRAVALRFADRTVVLSPDDPERFVDRLRARLPRSG